MTLTSAGGECNAGSVPIAISDDGRYALFATTATNVHPGDTDALPDFYLRDRQAGTTEWISKRLPGTTSVWGCGYADMSPDARFVVFDCLDDNVLPSDSNGVGDVFLLDRQTGVVEFISFGPTGQPTTTGCSFDPAVSDDGRRVSFLSLATDWLPQQSAWEQVWVRDRVSQTTTLVSVRPDGYPARNGCYFTSISGDGRTVAFQARDPEGLAIGQPPPKAMWDSYVRDIELGATELVTVNKDGLSSFGESRHPYLSREGRYVVFSSYANDLVALDGHGGEDVFVRDRQTQVTTLVSVGHQGQFATQQCTGGFITDDGRSVSFTSLDSSLVPGVPGFHWLGYVRDCLPDPTTVYCASLPNSLGCKPLVTVAGTPSASLGGGFTLSCQRLVSGTLGIYYYGTSGTLAQPLAGFFQCVAPPIVRTGVATTGGSLPPDCIGKLSIDFNAWIASGVDPTLFPGTTVYGQFWSRDPAAPSTMHLSPASAFTIEP